MAAIRRYHLSDTIMQYQLDQQAKYGNVSQIQLGPVPHLVLFDPDLISDVLKKHAKNYTKTEIFRTVFKPIIGLNNLFVSDGQQHEQSRRMIQPAFHFVKLQSMISIMTQKTTEAIDEWLLTFTAEKKELDLPRELNSLTLSIIASSAFGEGFETIQDGKRIICNLFTHVVEATQWRSMNLINQIPLLSKLPLWKKDIVDNGAAEIAKFVNQIILDRKTGKSHSICSGNDLLDLLLLAKDDDDNGLSDQEIQEQALTFVLAGHETSGNLMAWCLYVLMTHPKVYEACQQEVDEILKGQLPVYSQLNELEIIDAVLHETLRLYPPAPFFSRQCVEEHSIGEGTGTPIRIPVGGVVLFNLYVLHRSEQFWNDSLKFDYKRWMRSSETGHRPKLAHPFCYLPFGAGNRNCIGQNFAMLETKVILAILLQRLKFEIVPGQKIVPDVKITMKPKYGLLARVTSRT
ncbi:unnamed protein product [Didymodactylos carnosus]|nr:unnamed protein product [Didymodactylos carnosus]